MKRQRRLAKKLAPLELVAVDEKACRKEIDALLLGEGFKSGEGVTCRGYDVVHRERKGQTSYDVVLLAQELITKLRELGMPDEDEGCVEQLETFKPGATSFVLLTIKNCSSTSDPAKFAEVKPMKGLGVRL